jgi:hypothetical protein
MKGFASKVAAAGIEVDDLELKGYILNRLDGEYIPLVTLNDLGRQDGSVRWRFPNSLRNSTFWHKILQQPEAYFLEIARTPHHVHISVSFWHSTTNQQHIQPT